MTYFKAALGLMLLREQILGPERFDPAFRRYIADWAFKHPNAIDFFRAMESEGGEDLSWFWRGWYFNNWTLDLAVTRRRTTSTAIRPRARSVTLESLRPAGDAGDAAHRLRRRQPPRPARAGGNLAAAQRA